VTRLGLALALAAALAGCAGGSGSEPGSIVFSAPSAGGGARHLYVAGADGSGVRRLTSTDGDAEPTWSPDGSRVAFKRWSNEGGCVRPHLDCAQIWTVAADGTGERRLTPRSRRSQEPDWSPDGERIAFVRWQDDENPWANETDIYVMRADGTGIRRLTEVPGDEGSPAWSPDGTRIAFTSDRHGSYDIFVMNADGSGIRRLTHTPVPEFAPAWSPDGKRIVFQNARNELVVMDAAGGGQRTLTRPFAGDAQPVWSPDGKRIAFLRRRADRAELYVVRDDGSDPRALEIAQIGEPSDPDWSAEGT
jgi:TolB protein